MIGPGITGITDTKLCVREIEPVVENEMQKITCRMGSGPIG